VEGCLETPTLTYRITMEEFRKAVGVKGLGLGLSDAQLER
jgi:hypothetical protein